MILGLSGLKRGEGRPGGATLREWGGETRSVCGVSQMVTRRCQGPAETGWSAG